LSVGMGSKDCHGLIVSDAILQFGKVGKRGAFCNNKV